MFQGIPHRFVLRALFDFRFLFLFLPTLQVHFQTGRTVITDTQGRQFPDGIKDLLAQRIPKVSACLYGQGRGTTPGSGE